MASIHRKLPRHSLPYLGNPWHGSAAFGLTSLALISPGLYVTVISIGAGHVQSALAAVVQKWVQPIVLLPSAIATQMFPQLSAAKSDAAALELLQGLRKLVLIACIPILLIVLGAPALVSVLLGTKYDGSVAVLQLYGLSLLPVVAGQPLSALVQARGGEASVARITVPVALASLALCYAVSGSLGAKSAPIVNAIYSLVLLIWLLWIIRTRFHVMAAQR